MTKRGYTVEAFVLHRRDVGDTDKLLVLFTREQGRIVAIARGARKPNSSLVGSTDALCFAKFFLARGRAFEYVTQAQPLRCFTRVRGDLLRTACALELAEIVERSMGERQANVGVYDLLVWSMELLDGPLDPAAVSAWAEMQLMSVLGYRPHVADCALCHAPLAARALFAASIGGLVCKTCASGIRDVLGLPGEAVMELQRLATAEAPPEELVACGALRRVYRSLWQHVLDSDLRSAKFLDDLLGVG